MPLCIVKVIREGCFAFCYGLSSVIFASDCVLNKIKNGAFQECLISTIILPEQVSSIGEGCFQVCRNLRSITFPASLASFGEYSFEACDNLQQNQLVIQHLKNVHDLLKLYLKV